MYKKSKIKKTNARNENNHILQWFLVDLRIFPFELEGVLF